jgi:hypothetical protein
MPGINPLPALEASLTSLQATMLKAKVAVALRVVVDPEDRFERLRRQRKEFIGEIVHYLQGSGSRASKLPQHRPASDFRRVCIPRRARASA